MGLGIACFAASGRRISGHRAEIVAEGGLAPTALGRIQQGFRGASRAGYWSPVPLGAGGLGVHCSPVLDSPGGSAGEQGQALEIMLGKAF